MPSSHLILCHLLLLLPPIPPSIRVISNESTLHMRWPKYWSFSFSIIPSKEIPGLISFRMDWLVVVLNKEKFYYSSSTLVEAGVIQSEHVVVHVCTCVHMCVCTCGPSSNLFRFTHVWLAVSGKDVGELPGADLWKDIWVEREYGDSLVRCS